MQLVLAVVVAVGVAVSFGRIWLRRHKDAPLRREVRAQDVIFRTELEYVKMTPNREWWTGTSSWMELVVRVDAFEVSCPLRPVRVVLGLEYYFKARETTIRVTKAPSGILKRDWIVVTGQRLGQEIQLAIAQSTYRGGIPDAWNALVRAGSVPVGPPPPDRSEAGRG